MEKNQQAEQLKIKCKKQYCDFIQCKQHSKSQNDVVLSQINDKKYKQCQVKKTINKQSQNMYLKNYKQNEQQQSIHFQQSLYHQNPQNNQTYGQLQYPIPHKDYRSHNYYHQHEYFQPPPYYNNNKYEEHRRPFKYSPMYQQNHLYSQQQNQHFRNINISENSPNMYNYGHSWHKRGHGRHNGFDKYQGQKRHHHHHHRHHHDDKKKKRKRSSSFTSSSTSFSQNQGRRQQQSLQQQKLKKTYYDQMNSFFESRSINEKQRQKIINFLYKFYPPFPPFDLITECLQHLEKQKLMFKISYVKAIKIMSKWQFNEAQIFPRLKIIQMKKLKKQNADLNYNTNYGQGQEILFLQLQELINLDKSKAIFLIDGNNILPTNKHFRKFFKSNLIMEKIEAQVRLKCLIGHSFEKEEAILFFDQKYQEKDYNIIIQQHISGKAKQNYNKIETIFAGNGKADDKIIQKIIEIKGLKMDKNIILVSADRELSKRSKQVLDLKRTSGKFFFKYCKYQISLKYNNKKEYKGVTKQIMKYKGCQ